MRKLHRFQFAILSIFFFYHVSSAQWIQTNGPSQNISTLAVSGSNLFAGTWVGVFLSTDNGASWTAVNSGLTTTIVFALAVSGSNLFAGTQGGGVFLSSNNGASWTAVNSGLTNTDVRALAVSGTNLFAGTYNGGIFLSPDNGTSWTAVNNGLPSTHINCLTANGSNVFAGTDGYGVFLSTNSGTSWTAASSGLPNSIVYALAANGTNLFAGISGNGVFLSTNNGSSWTAAKSGLPSASVIALAVSGSNLFAGTYVDGVYLSTNNGTNWTAANTGLKNTPVWCLAVNGANIFAGTGIEGVYRSTNNGTSWTAASSGLTNAGVSALAISGTNLFAGTSNAVFLSTDNGTSWTAVNNGLPYNVGAKVIAVNGTNIFAGTSAADGVYLSTNNGTSWTAVNSGLPSYTAVSALAVSGTRLFAGSAQGGVFLSTNNGTSWTAASSGLPSASVNALAVNGTSLFAGTRGGVFLSTDNGASWTAASSGLTNTNVQALVASGTTLFAGTTGGIFLSTNNGTSWTAASSGLPSASIIALAASGSNVFAGTQYYGVFVSTNNGSSWTAVNSGLLNSYVSLIVNVFAINGTNIFIGTYGSSVWHAAANSLIPPSSPENLIATDSSSRTITIKWQKNTEVDFLRYRIYRGTSPSPITKVDSTTAGITDTSKTFTGLTNGTRYYFRITGVDSTGNESAYSNEVNAVPADRIAPSSPQNLAVTDSSSRTIIIKWRRNTESDILRYRIYRATSPSPAVKVDSTTGGITDTTRTFTGLTNGIRYYLRVTAVDSAGNESAYSNEVNTIPADRIVPATPQNLIVFDSSSAKIGIKWRKNTDADFMRYRIYRNTLPNAATKVDSSTANPTDTSKTFTGLTIGTKYYLRVTAVDSAGNESAYSNEVNAIPGVYVAPAAPQNLVVTDSSSRTIILKWRKNTEADFLRYRVYRGTSPAPSIKVDSTSGGIGDTSKTFTGLTNGTRYYFRVTAVDSVGIGSGYSNEANATAADRIAPTAPQNTAVTDSSSKTVTLKWRKNTEADFLRYRIYRGTSPGPTSQVDSTLGGNSDTIKTFTGLTNGTRYYFKVTAIDSTGNQSAYSNEVNAVPADRIPPAVPTKLVLVDTSSTKVGIKWSKNTEPDFMRYRIYRATSPNPTTKVDSTTAGVSDTSKTFTGLTNGTRYYLRVTAVDSAGNESPYSNEVSGVPKATLAVEGLSNQIPTEYMIAQNYPNPFNPSTLIRFGIPVRSSVHLQIYNVLGQCIERLVNEELEAGYFEKVWQAGIASGIYFYRIDAVSTTDPNNRFVQVKKMLLLK